MNRFDRYVLAIFVKYILIIQLLIMIVTMFASALGHLQDLVKYNITLPALIKLELITLPMGINSVMPITMVVSSIVTVLLLMRSKELLAYVCLGGRIKRFLVPFVVAAIFAACFMFFFDHKIHPNIRRAQQKYMTETIKKQKYVDQRTLYNLWTMDKNKLVHVEFVDPLNNKVWNITEYILNESFQVDMIRTINLATPSSDNWTFFNIRTADISALPPLVTDKPEELTDSVLLNDLMIVSAKTPRQLAPSELSQTIAILKKRGLGTVKYEMILKSKYSNALSVIVLVILMVPLGIDFSRRYSPVKSAAISFPFGIAFWALLAVLDSLGNSGILSPLTANFAPHIVFTIIGIVILYQRENAH